MEDSVIVWASYYAANILEIIDAIINSSMLDSENSCKESELQ